MACPARCESPVATHACKREASKQARVRVQEAKLVLIEAQPSASEGYEGHLDTLQEWVDAQMTGADAAFTPRGLWFDRQRDAAEDRGWGRLSHAAHAAHVTMRVAAIVDASAVTGADEWRIAWAHRARCFALSQMQYIAGSGPASTGRSFVTSWGEKPPSRPRHRGAACRWEGGEPRCRGAAFLNATHTFPNVLPGALVSGPNGVDEFPDDHTNERTAYVATHYNAGLVSGACSAAEVVCFC